MTPTHIIVHCTASEWGTVLDVDRWHRERGWAGVGYHAVILNGYSNAEDYKHRRRDWLMDGQIQPGRSLDMDAELAPQEVGAHAVGWNHKSVAVCLVGNGSYTPNQKDALVRVARAWMMRYGIPATNLKGHCELPGVSKLCPALDMEWVRDRVTVDVS